MEEKEEGIKSDTEIRNMTPLAKANEDTKTRLDRSLKYTKRKPIKVLHPAKKVITKGTIISPIKYMKKKEG